MIFGNRLGNVKIHKHHRNSAVYEQGRYLCVEMKISLKNKRGREIAQETAQAILDALDADAPTLTDIVPRGTSDNPQPPDSQ